MSNTQLTTSEATMTTATKKTAVTIYGNEYEIKVGSLVRPEKWAFSRRLEDGQGVSSFYLPTTSGGPITHLATEVEITGRTMQRVEGDYAVRVKFTLHPDWEGDRVFYGWFFIDR
jgi:hypothetical protein